MPANTRLRAYTGHPLKVHRQPIPLLVFEGSGNIRLSERDFPQGVASHLRTTIQNHPNVFKSGLGTVKGIKAKL